MFQRIISILSIIVFFVIIFIGYMSWNEKIAKTTQKQISKDVQADTSETMPLTFEKLQQAITHLPESVQQMFKETYVNKEQINVVFVGSTSTGLYENGWSMKVKDALEKFYGTDLLKISIYEFDGTSTEFLNSELPEQIIEESPHLVFLESFRLADNYGFVTVEAAQENLITFIEQISTELPEAAFIVQPPNPLSSAVNYPKEVEEIQQFLETNGIPYFNHWEKWPISNSEEMELLLKDGLPNEKGHEIWAEAIIDYFIATEK